MGSVGSSRSELYHSCVMLSYVLASALVAIVSAEADADAAVLYSHAGYAGFGYGYPYAYGAFPYAYHAGVKSAPCVNAANVPVPCAAGYVHAIGKREAEADADAALVYSHAGYAGYGFAGYPYAYGAFPYYAGVKSAPCVNAANIPVPCAGVHALHKREADADAALLYTHAGYAGYAGFGGYTGFGYPYTYGTYAAPAVVPAVGVAATNNVLGHAVAHTAFGVTHSSNVGVCTNYLGEQVAC